MAATRKIIPAGPLGQANLAFIWTGRAIIAVDLDASIGGHGSQGPIDTDQADFRSCPSADVRFCRSPAEAQGSSARRALISFSSAASTTCRGLLAVADWAAEDDKAIIDEPLHECRVPIPGLLVPDLTRRVPARAVDQPHRELAMTGAY